MTRRSKIAVLVPIALLLVRNFFPVTQGQLLPYEWNHKTDPIILYRQQMALPTPDRVSLSNPGNKYWSTVPDSSFTNPVREVVEIPPPMLKAVGQLSQQLSPNGYILLKEQRHNPQRSITPGLASVDILEALNSKLLYQKPKKRQDQQKETDTLASGSGPLVDYSTDEEPSAQIIQPASSNMDDYSQSPSSKAKIKHRQASIPDDLARYLIFSNLKRARDGYICHFKLCQVGVSGKRLSNNM